MPELRLPQLATAVVCGRTVHSAKITTSASGTKIAKFSIAADRGYGEKKESSFFDLVCFGVTAEIAEKHLGNGHGIPLIADCSVQQERWEKNGVKRSAVKFIVNRLHILAWPDKAGAAPDTEAPDASEDAWSEI